MINDLRKDVSDLKVKIDNAISYINSLDKPETVKQEAIKKLEKIREDFII
jgi:hypothetical protein